MAIEAKNLIPPFDARHLDAISRVMGDTVTGLSGSEIRQLLVECQIDDPNPEMTKWKRLYNAFVAFQIRNNAGNHVLVFIRRAMIPASYTRDPQLFELRRNQLNPIISFSGIELDQNGQLKRVAASKTLDEALVRANRFQAALKLRNVHSDILRYCTAEILAQNYFHAVFEALKSISAKIRIMTGFTCDGADLAREAFQLGRTDTPAFAINDLATETDKGEQRQGQRSLNRCTRDDLEQVVFVPATTATLHRNAVTAGMLLQQRKTEPIEPGEILTQPCFSNP